MTRKINAKMEGFTPLFDTIAKEHGIITAAVYGKMWRYAQMKDGACKASQERLAGELGLTRQTINKHIETLIASGYIVDKTPTLAGAPHVYSVTKKADLSIYLTADAVKPVNEIDTTCQNGLHLPVNEIDTKKQLRNKEETIQRARKTVDGILEFERKGQGKKHTTLNEMQVPYADAFVQATGIKMTDRERGDWLMTIQEWIDAGYQPHDVTRAVNSVRSEGRLAITRPGSITWKMRSQGVYKHVEEEAW
jgi:biotin operon repressor